MRITAILCTFNRARTLAKALESLATQTLPRSVGWEILVVDNNSSDETRQVVEGFQQRHPGRIRYLSEPQQGLSNARNAGVQAAQGDIVAFMDDDETAGPEWLQNLTANLSSREWAGAGGRVLPQWNGSRPRWLSSKNSFTLGPLAIFDPDLEAGKLTEPPFGANMAFRREMFDKYGGFRTDLGRSGTGMLSGEDTEFGRRLLAAGERLRYEPSALTFHPVEEMRLHQEYFLQWWFNKGRSDARELGIQTNGKHILGIPLRLFRGFVVGAVKWMFTIEPSQRFVHKLRLWACTGQALESYYQLLDSKRQKQESF